MQGHTGPLCGSCEKGHGNTFSSSCEVCPTTVGNLLVICTSSVILLVLSAVAIRGNLSTVSNATRRNLSTMSNATRRNMSTMSNGQMAVSLGCEWRSRSIELPELSPTDRSEERAPQEAQSSSIRSQGIRQIDDDDGIPASETVLAKWKAVEMLKVNNLQACLRFVILLQITLNFIQVTVLIVSVDVGWAISMLIIAQVAGKQSNAFVLCYRSCDGCRVHGGSCFGNDPVLGCLSLY